uniref:Intraflagellar transport 52 homolog (Chlamydomonas) n=1 Tax=Hucho hucho TaxID=62062 RepID=A0A4W5QTN8_9TELE
QWKIQSIKEELSLEKLTCVKLWITAGPREKFTAAELEVLKELKYNTNINFLLEEFRIMVNNDVVVRNAYYKYFHPKKHLYQRCSKQVTLTFVFPYGATLSMMKPAVAVLSTGSVCYPLNRPVLAFYQVKAGKLAVMGSCHMFSDQYLDKEENRKIMDVVFQWLMGDTINLNQIDAEDPKITDYTMLPDTGCLSVRLRVHLQEENPRDFTSLFDMSTQLVATGCCLLCLHQMNVKHEPLQLITPQFETPLPQLEPAVSFPSPALHNLTSSCLAQPSHGLDVDSVHSTGNGMCTRLY